MDAATAANRPDTAPPSTEPSGTVVLSARPRPGWAVAWDAVNTPAGVLIGVLTAIVLLWGRLDDTLDDMRGDLMNEFRTEFRALDGRTQERFDVIEKRLDRIEQRHAEDFQRHTEDFADIKAELRELREPLIAEALRRPDVSEDEGE